MADTFISNLSDTKPLEFDYIESLYQIYGKYVFGMATRQLKDSKLAEEVTQEAL